MSEQQKEYCRFCDRFVYRVHSCDKSSNGTEQPLKVEYPDFSYWKYSVNYLEVAQDE